MDIIIRTRSNQQYKLARQDKAAPNPHLTTDQLGALFAEAEPVSPPSWLELWQRLNPGSAGNSISPQAVVGALRDLAARHLLVVSPHSSRSSRRPNRGASSGTGAGSAEASEAAPAQRSTAAPESAKATYSEDHAVASDGAAKGGDQSVKTCPTEGEPISMTSGEELLQLTDCHLPGPLPFSWTRTYRSSHTRDAGLGCGWTHSASEHLEITAQQLLYRDSEGREISLPLPRVHQRSRYIPEGLTLDRVTDDIFVLRQEGEPDKVFSRDGQRSSFLRLTQLRHPAYTPANNLLGIAQRERGFAIQLLYNKSNQLTQVQGNWGKSLLLGRNEEGRIIHVELVDETTGARKTLVEYDYSAAGDLVAQRNAKGTGESYRYENHLIHQRTLASGFNFYFEWDAVDSSARCVRQWGDRGIYDYHFEWAPERKRSKAINSRGHAREYTYNQYGQVVEELDCEGGLHQYSYERGRKRSYTDPEGHTTEYFYDRQNNPAGYRDALGNRVSLGWFNGRLTSITDKDRSHWRRDYDARGQLVALTDPFHQTTRYTYTPDGLPATVVDPIGRTTRYQWSERGELLVVTDADGHTRRLAYDPWGQVSNVETLLANGQSAGTIRFFYTATGLVEKVVAPNGDTTHYTYNDTDQLIRHSDPQGRTTEFRFDGLSQVIERIDPEGQRLKYEYDSERNLTALVNQKGEKHQFFYDGNERLIKEVGFDGRVQHYKYDKAGRLIKHLDAGEIITDFERDAIGQLLTRASRSITNPTLPAELARFRYDAKGRLVESYNVHQFVTFAYNAFGNLTREHHSDLNQERQRVTASMVDIGFSNIWPGQCSGLQLPDGQRIDYGFDAHNRLSDIIVNGQAITRIDRDLLGRESRRTQGDLVTLSDYDPNGRLQRQRTYHENNKHPGPVQREYGYDAFGNLNLLRDGPQETRYVYDLLDRLKKAEGNLPETFAFDPAGNLLQAGDGAPGSARGNRLAMQGDRKFTYDARGNLVQENRGKDGKLVTTFEYNLTNQLIKTTRDGQVTTYAYDPLGRRIGKTDAFGTTRYLWAGDQMVQEQRNSQKKTYIYEPESFRPVAQIVDGNTYHYHLDRLGTPRELTDTAGKIVWKARYKTYGNLAVQEVEEVENNLRFQGQYFDAETGLHYNRFRYYNPNTGQFISQDPIGLLGGVNNYQYAPNPTGWVDPWGLTARKEDPTRQAKALAEASAGKNEVLPDNYDFLDDRYTNPVGLGQAHHNLARDIEDLLQAQSSDFFLKELTLVKDARGLYEASSLKRVIEYHEFLAIRAYTDDYYRGINPALRSGNPGNWQIVAASADEGLKKLAQSPTYGYEGTLTRGLSFPGTPDDVDAMVEQLFPDKGIFSDKTFMSSSYDSTKSFSGNVKVTIETKNKHARIDDISVYDNAEAEVLIRPNAEFTVVQKQKMPDGTWKIHLKEKA